MYDAQSLFPSGSVFDGALTGIKGEGLDKVKCMKMALVHDMGEAIIGDITPADNVPKGMSLVCFCRYWFADWVWQEEKNRLELDAVKTMAGLI